MNLDESWEWSLDIPAVNIDRAGKTTIRWAHVIKMMEFQYSRGKLAGRAEMQREILSVLGAAPDNHTHKINPTSSKPD